MAATAVMVKRSAVSGLISITAVAALAAPLVFAEEESADPGQSQTHGPR